MVGPKKELFLPGNSFWPGASLLVQGLGEFLQTGDDLRRFRQHRASQFLSVIRTALRHFGESHHDGESIINGVLYLAELLLQLAEFFGGNGGGWITHVRANSLEKRDGYA